ncbi:MAG: CapA family protein [Oscillospiraceae bacterium]|nr:CapA family protein [Oscillospiraceae bacterium]
MSQTPRITCKHCDRTYSELKYRCPYCGAHRSEDGQHVAEASNKTARRVISLLLFAALAIGAVSMAVLGLGDDLASASLSNPPGISQAQGEDTEAGVQADLPPVEPEPEPEPVEIRIQFAGDVLMHSGFGIVDVAWIGQNAYGENMYDFKPYLRDISPFVDGDLAIINMETPVDALGGNQGISTFPLFNVPFEILPALQYAGFNHLISANNHSFDRGWTGLINTVYSFERAGISHTGMSVDEEAFNTPTILDVNGIQVGIIAYTDSANGLEFLIPDYALPWAVRRFRSHVMDDVPAMAADIAALRAAGAEVVIVALHWGAEYVDAPTEMQRQIARALSDAGADVIMGKHSHTVQPLEWHYREDGTRALIIYSLGNFLADQTRLTPPSVADQINSSFGRTQFGMLVSLQIVREPNGEIRLTHADVLPTLCMRDFAGNTLFTANAVSVLPIINGELPAFVVAEDLRLWGRHAYAHVVRVVGEEWIAQNSHVQ